MVLQIQAIKATRWRIAFAFMVIDLLSNLETVYIYKIKHRNKINVSSRKGLDVGRQGLDEERQGLDVGRQGLDERRQGLDVGRQGLDVERQGLDEGRQGLDVGRHGLDVGRQGLDV